MRVIIDTNAYTTLMAGNTRIADVWIAASCLEHGARLFTLDSHFAEIDGLMRDEI